MHWLTRDEARRWLAGSAVPRILRHSASPESAARIIRRGVDLNEASADSVYGAGFYASTRFEPAYGEVSIEVAVRLERPLVLASMLVGVDTIEQLLREAGTDDVRVAVLSSGYDGLVVEEAPGGGTWVIAYRERAVRVLRER